MKQAQATRSSDHPHTALVGGKGRNESDRPAAELLSGGAGCVANLSALQCLRTLNSDANMFHC